MEEKERFFRKQLIEYRKTMNNIEHDIACYYLDYSFLPEDYYNVLDDLGRQRVQKFIILFDLWYRKYSAMLESLCK